MIVAFEFPDLASDKAAGKRTLLVRLGRQRGARVHNALIVLAFVLLLVLSFLGLPALVAILAAITAPLALWQAIAVVRMGMGKPVPFGWFTFRAVSLFAITSSLMALGFWVK
jgi:1,4-dihydroxy-2-naphthoate octaprenyltransferase